MEVSPSLIFRLRESLYALDALAVREILPLPAITALEETPDYVLGVINLRGQIVPVVDLDRRFGHTPQRFQLEDDIVILEQAGRTIGIVVNEVLNVRDIAPGERLPLPSYGPDVRSEARFLTGLTKSGEQVVMLLHTENLLRLSSELPESEALDAPLFATPADDFCPDATPQEKAVFKERAHHLAQTPENQDQTERLPLALVRLGEELFGIALQGVREFADLPDITPVPCCPEYIVGQMNLRGDLVTLVDIAHALQLPPVRNRANGKVVVVNDAELRAGVLVDEILDVLYLLAADVSPVPTSNRANGQEYRQGTARHGSRMLSLLDLPTLLKQESLLVNETP